MMRRRPKDLPPQPPQPRIIVGFDSEWVRETKGRNRILSYQLVVLNADTTRMSSTFIEPNGPSRRHRKSLTGLLEIALWNAVREGVIPDVPDKLVLASHFARADITALRDFNAIKRRLTAVRKTYTTTDRPLSTRIGRTRGEKPCSVTVVDTMLLCAAKTPLEQLGKDLGLPKVELPVGYSKEQMDLFLAERREDFIAYALTDARIAALWAARIGEIMRDIGVTKHVATLGAASVILVKQELAKLDIDLNEFLGKDASRRGKARTKPKLVDACPYAAQCYHGGLNIAFALGLSPEGRELIDVDLKSAYTTALALIQIPDWNSARRTFSLGALAVTEEAMTFAHVRFKFPNGTKFPGLPVRASEARGLVYPLEGSSWCTGPEIVTALMMGAEIDPLSGWRIDWQEGEAIRPLEGFTRHINEIRARAVAASDTVKATTMKEIGNSAYGKIAQAVASMRVIQDDAVFRRTFDAKWGETETLGPSAITQPLFAAHCTGLVRAALSEAVARLPASAWTASATTDGILFAGSEVDLDVSGPVAQAFARARARITPDKPNVWEVKHVPPRVLIVKTRGAYTVAPPGWTGKAICAQAGYRLPQPETRGLDPLQRSAVWLDLYRKREFETEMPNPSLTSLRDQHNKGLDLQMDDDRKTRWNADFDFKRRLMKIRNVEGLIAADSVPWRTVEEFEDTRDAFDEWRMSKRRVLKTAEDYEDFMDWAAGRASRSAVRMRSHNRLLPLARGAMLAAIHGALGVEKLPYQSIATVWTALCQVEVNVMTVKNAMRRGAEPDQLKHSIAYMTAGDEAFAASLLYWRPSAFPLLFALCKPGTEAERQTWEALGRAKDAHDMDAALSAEPEFDPDFEPDTDDDDSLLNAPEAVAFDDQSHWSMLTP